MKKISGSRNEHERVVLGGQGEMQRGKRTSDISTGERFDLSGRAKSDMYIVSGYE